MHQRRSWPAAGSLSATGPALAAVLVFTLGGATPRLVAQAPAPAADAARPDAAVVLAAARAALGGEARLASVKTFTATGRTRRVQGTNLVPIEFEISCELPRRCVRRDEIPARESGPTTVGFDGDTLIQFPVAPAPRPGGPVAPAPGGEPPAVRHPDSTEPAVVRTSYPAGSVSPVPALGRIRPTSASGSASRDFAHGGTHPPSAAYAQGGRGLPPGFPGGRGMSPADLAAARVNTIKQEFAYLWLGMFAASVDTYPLTFTYAALAEAPQGTAHVLDVRGPANFSARLFVHADTHLPVMVAWDGLQQGKPVEHRIYYADYRAVDGMQFPFRLRRAIGAETSEETTIDRFRVNVRVDRRKFEGR